MWSKLSVNESARESENASVAGETWRSESDARENASARGSERGNARKRRMIESVRENGTAIVAETAAPGTTVGLIEHDLAQSMCHSF